MPKAVVRNGTIMPLEPLPPEWHDGTEVMIEAVREEDRTSEEFERAFDELERMCAQGDEADSQRLQAVLAEADREANEWFQEMEAAVAIREADDLAKQQVRREMGLP
jgi:hypothetical protein